MSKPLVTTRKALLAAVLLLLLSSLLPTRYASYISKMPTGVVDFASVPVSRPVNWLSHKIRSEPVGRVEQLTESQWMLEKEQYDRLNRELWTINRDLQASLAAFRAIYILEGPEDFKPVEAAVVSFNNERTNPVMLISQGTRAGIQGQDPVVFRTNLLGFVEKNPGVLNSKVELLNRPDRRLRVGIKPEGVDGFNQAVIEYATTHASGEYFYLDRPIGHGVEVGYIAFAYDDRYMRARGFLLGRIVQIQNHPDRPLAEDRIIIRPDVPIGPQGRVMVITEREE